MSEAGVENRGNTNDYAFGTPEGWNAFDVVRWHSIEELSHPYRFEIVLLRRAEKGPADLDSLVGASVSFRIATSARWRVVHGIVAEAEEIDRTGTIFLYRVVMVPHVVKACHRRRCRNFVDKSIQEILKIVLENKSPAYPDGNGGLAELSGSPEAPPATPSWDAFTAPTAKYRLAITDTSRITDATVSPYIVQYGETDFDFLSRLLEREGITYYFEQTADATVLTLTDEPGQAPLASTDAKFQLRGVAVGGGAAAREQEVVRTFRDARRLRASSVTVREYDWHRSRTLFQGESQGDGDADVFGVFELLGEDENTSSGPGDFPAKIRLQRLQAEQKFREGTGTVRTKEPGYKFTLADDDQLRDDVELLLVRVETYAAALFPEGTVLDDEPFGFNGIPPKSFSHTNRFLALPTSVPFRPAIRTQKPRVHGVQPAVVTAEEFSGSPPEINADANGSVRVRFFWDQRTNTNDGTPSSNWVRVSHAWAGGGYGSLWTPRVGHEVLVAYVQGDPERPIIVGRMYNPQSPPPYDASKDATKSTFKSQSSPNATGSNELRFEDKAGSEEIFLHAQLDMNEEVKRNHSAKVGLDHAVSVKNNQKNDVGVNHTQTVGADHSNSVGGNHSNTVAGNHTNAVGGDQTNTVGGSRTHGVGGSESASVGGSRTHAIGGSHTVTVAAAHTSSAGATHHFIAPVVTVDAGGSMTVNTTTFVVHAGSATLAMMGGVVVLGNGAGSLVALIGGMVLISSPGVHVTMSGGPMLLNAAGGWVGHGSTTKVDAGGGSVIKAGGSITIDGSDISAKGGTIKLNG